MKKTIQDFILLCECFAPAPWEIPVMESRPKARKLKADGVIIDNKMISEWLSLSRRVFWDVIEKSRSQICVSEKYFLALLYRI